MQTKNKSNNVIGLSLVVVILCFVLSWLSLLPAVKESRQKVSEGRSAVQQAQDKLAAFESADQKIIELKQTIEKVAIAVPESTNYQSVLVSLEAISSKEGMAISSFQPATNTSSTGSVFPKSSFTFTTIGDFAHVSSFINDIETNLRIMKIDTLNLSQIGNDTLQMTATISVFSRQTSTIGGEND